MVYCTKCGAQNEDDASHCVKCGASLKVSQSEKRNWEDELERGAENLGRMGERFGKQMEDECFGIPQGNTVIGIIIGLIIIFVGLRELYGWRIDIGPYIIIIIGILIAAGALFSRQKKTRRY